MKLNGTLTNGFNFVEGFKMHRCCFKVDIRFESSALDSTCAHVGSIWQPSWTQEGPTSWIHLGLGVMEYILTAVLWWMEPMKFYCSCLMVFEYVGLILDVHI